MSHTLRNFVPADAEAVNAVALASFEQYRDQYSNWDVFARNIGNMSALADAGEIIVATVDGRIVGAVVYVGPNLPKREFFPVQWPILRMLVVSPEYRGAGIGRALTEECIARARRDGAALVGLHTSVIMNVALPMYERLGFKFHSEAPQIFGVPYRIYVKDLL